MAAGSSERNRAAEELFAPLAQSYDRYARLLSLGQDPRWRDALVERVEARPVHVVLDVATGTGAVAIRLARRYGCRVVGVDQSAEMLAEGRRRVAAAGLADSVELRQARAEGLPFEDASFDGLTFTYLLRYVDDPALTLRELARTVRPGGRVAMLEFFVPRHRTARLPWEAYVGVGLPLAGRLIANGWAEVGSFLGPSIRDFWERWPPERLRGAWQDAGIRDVQARLFSLGGAIVMWGTHDE
ncbi:MAG TPA: class I SAM-dependent methyltransferase [Gaiellaceae bacterium]|nr:class I SAM-dependent methyltransferase [Gaiellaceae bacterium]